MFLDEELEQIYNLDIDRESKVKKMKKAWIERLPKTSCTAQHYANCIERVDNSWRLFCHRHKEYNVEGFRMFVNEFAKENPKSIINEIIKYLPTWWRNSKSSKK